MSIKIIIQDVEKFFGFEPGTILRQNRQATVVKARKLAIYVAKRYGYSFSEIADVFNRHITTITHLHYHGPDISRELEGYREFKKGRCESYTMLKAGIIQL